MRVVKANGDGTASVVEAPIPTLRPNYITVKTHAVAINPTDWKHVSFVKEKTTIGVDFAGVIVEVGSEVTKDLKEGDRVCGFTHGGNEVHAEDGGHGEYLTALGDIAMKIPDHLSFEEAASLPVGVLTCGQGLYQSLQLPMPEKSAEEKLPILIYGGSTATGIFAIQFAKLSGFEVITTCSPRNFELVKSFGADVVFDYSEPDVGSKIRAHTKNKLYTAFDTISEHSSPSICAAALSSDSSRPLKYGAILTAKSGRDDVLDLYTIGYTAVGEYFTIRGRAFEAKPEDFEFMKAWSKVSEALIAEGKIKPHRIEKKGDLDDIIQGMEDMKNGKVSGSKWVYTIA